MHTNTSHHSTLGVAPMTSSTTTTTIVADNGKTMVENAAEINGQASCTLSIEVQWCQRLRLSGMDNFQFRIGHCCFNLNSNENTNETFRIEK